jgi:Ca2+-binding RTX toxin-like protein
VSGPRLALRVAVCGTSVLIAATLGSLVTAANSVPTTKAGQQSAAIDAQALAPSQCAGMGLTAIVTTLNGGGARELVLGTSAAETLDGRGDRDCLVGGGGNDILNGGGGTDVCLGGAGIDTFVSCETQIQ